MRKFAITLATAMVTVLGTMVVAPTQAQPLHTWVASSGNDGNDCTRPTPCATFQGAYNKTFAGGEITCVDSGAYVGLLISKSITINCENAMASNAQGLTFNVFTIQTTASDVVILRGFDIDGHGYSGAGANLINFIGAGALQVDRMKVSNILGPDSGIRFAPNGPARLDVFDSFIAHNGGQTGTAGILVQPQSGGFANVSVSRSNLQGNVNGIFVDGSAGAVNLNVSDSVVTGSSNSGIALFTSGAPVTALIDGTKVHYNLNTGVAAAGQAVTVRIGRSTISNNVTGVAAFNGATIRSYKDNRINANSSDGTPLLAEGLN